MSLASRFVDWIRAGYPAGVPARDFQPLMALVRRRLGPEEAAEIAREVHPIEEREEPRIDIGVEITKVLDDTPSDDDVERVLRHLEERGAGPAPA